MSATQANKLSNDELVKIFHRAANAISHAHIEDYFLYHFALAVMFASPKELAQIRCAALLIIDTHQLT